MRKWLILGVAVALVVVLVCFFRPHPAPIIPAREVTVKQGIVTSLPVKVGDPVVVQIPRDESKWKSIVIVPTSRDMMLDIGLGYEVIKIDPPILPEISLDAIATPARYGVGLSTPLTEHVDLEAGVSKRWDQSEIEKYVGVGFHIEW